MLKTASKETICHVWFDFSETIARIKTERSDRLRYETYARLTDRPIDSELIREYEALFEQFHHSNAAVFRSLGKDADFWSNCVNAIPPEELYALTDERVPEIVQKVRASVPISIFSNLDVRTILPFLHIEPTWFTHMLSAGMVREPKPALEGFLKMVELSGVPAGQVLYIGDHVEKDVLPAKSIGLQTGLLWKQSPEADYCFQRFEDILQLFQG